MTVIFTRTDPRVRVALTRTPSYINAVHSHFITQYFFCLVMVDIISVTNMLLQTNIDTNIYVFKASLQGREVLQLLGILFK